MEQLNSLPYLESVVREVLRLYAPVSSTHRIAMHDTEIPLQKPFMDKQGVSRDTVRYEITIFPCSTQLGGADFLSRMNGNRVSKGDFVIIPIRHLNRSTEVWGEDANEFRYAQASPFTIMLYVLTVEIS